MPANKSPSSSIPFNIQICLWLTVFFWSSALVGIRIGLQGYHPGALALLRYLIASLVLTILYWKLPQRRTPSFRDLLYIVFIGTVGIGIYNILINYGEIVVPAGIAGFIIGMMPVFTILFALLLLKEAIPPKSWWGVLIGFVGLYLIAISQDGAIKFQMGVLYILLAAILGSYYSVVQKTLFYRYHPLELVILTIWGGTLVMLIYMPDLIREIPKAPWESTAAAVYLGIFPAAVAYALWNYSISKAPAGRASIYLYAMPIVATILGMIVLREYPQPLELTGGIVTLIGALIMNYFYKKA